MISLTARRKKKYNFIKSGIQFLTWKVKVASETQLLPQSSNFTSFVPQDQALERLHLFTGPSTGLQLSASNAMDTHTSNGLCFETKSNLMAQCPNSFSSIAIKGCRLLLLSPLIFVIVM